jgi:hypothetical protein
VVAVNGERPGGRPPGGGDARRAHADDGNHGLHRAADTNANGDAIFVGRALQPQPPVFHDRQREHERRAADQEP